MRHPREDRELAAMLGELTCLVAALLLAPALLAAARRR
jgi:hypothetical protein